MSDREVRIVLRDHKELRTMQWGSTGILALFAAVFAWQTGELIWTLYTGEIWYMKLMMVFTIDGFSAIWFVAKVFYPFSFEDNYDKARNMFRICFWMSAACSIIYMNFMMDTRLSMDFSPNWLIAGFWGITLVFIWNLSVFAGVVESEKGRPSIEFVNKSIDISKKN